MRCPMERMLKLQEILTLTGVSRSTIWRWTKEGSFPKPARVSPRTIRWRASDVLNWIDSLSTD
ncbi:helix-turn-helix transcriptional regulator [Geobacter anodireducens]|uniref:helix-turn-helix transcriptional regulator n=1 Tax=Geobacter soli TaxID=1510391 RepID=UPI0009E21F9F